MTNPMRGETSLTLGGKEYKARLTLNALMEIEQATGVGIIKLAMEMAEGNITITNLLAVLHPALRGGGNDFDMKDVTEIVQEAGIVQITKVVAELLTETLSEEQEDQEGKKPEV